VQNSEITFHQQLRKRTFSEANELNCSAKSLEEVKMNAMPISNNHKLKKLTDFSNSMLESQEDDASSKRATLT
jgi:hypothetical protein